MDDFPYPYVEVPLANLHLDLENSRTGVSTTEDEASFLLWEEAERTICALGEHISKHGLNTADPLYVIPRDDDGEYTVVEGNRRLLALRSLTWPDSVTDSASMARKSFPAYRKAAVQLPSTAWCFVFPDRYQADMWIDLKHTGPGRGEGTAQWTPKAKYNRKIRRGDPREFGPELWTWLRRTYRHDKEMHDLCVEAEHTQYTYMQRVAQKESFRSTFKLSMTDTGLICEYSADAIRPVMKRLLVDISSHTIDPRSLGSFDEINNYVADTLAPLIVNQGELFSAGGPDATTSERHDHKTPDKEETAEADESIVADDSLSEGTESGQQEDLGPVPPNGPIDNVVADRLFPGLDFDQFGARVNAIGKQAQKIPINTNAEVCGVLCRVVVDLACTEFLARHDQTIKEDKVWKRVVTSLKVLDPNVTDPMKCQRQDLHETWKASDRGTQGLAVQRMNDFVHSILLCNAPSEVRHLNALFTPVLLAMERNLRQAPQPVSTGNQNGQA